MSRLRDIGWSLWDPIGLLEPGQKWDDDECRSFADEYDSYLVQAAGQLRRGVSEAAVVTYLIKIETEHMGLGFAGTARADAVVAAIVADDQLWTFSDV
ncbi:MAG: hypothetical protein AAF299_08775 [Pseudomonadota bacterium]